MSNASFPVIAAPGKLPAFWDRQAIFVANLLGLFFGNEAGTEALAREVGEVDSYGGRLLPIMDLLFRGGDNLLVLERAPDPALGRFFSDRLGLGLPQVEVLPHHEYLTLHHDSIQRHPLFLRLQAHPARWIDGYVTDDTLADLAGQLGKQTVSSPAGSRRGNNKRMLHEDMEADGLPIPPTYQAADLGQIARALDDLKNRGFRRAVVKAAVGASGIGLNKLPPLAEHEAGELAARIDPHFFYEGACLVQGWLEPGVHGVRGLRSPSVQIFVGDEQAELYDITEQILSDHSVHEGNESPPPYLAEAGGDELRRQLLARGEWAARWLHRQGYRGTASADFLLVEHDDGTTEVQICELNARVTGATYPSVLARRFRPQGAWLLRNLRLRRPLSGAGLLERLQRDGDLFSPDRRSGVLPVNFNFGTEGLVHKGQFLCLGDQPDECRRLIERATAGLDCLAERD